MTGSVINGSSVQEKREEKAKGVFVDISVEGICVESGQASGASRECTREVSA